MSFFLLFFVKSSLHNRAKYLALHSYFSQKKQGRYLNVKVNEASIQKRSTQIQKEPCEVCISYSNHLLMKKVTENIMGLTEFVISIGKKISTFFVVFSDFLRETGRPHLLQLYRQIWLFDT